MPKICPSPDAVKIVTRSNVFVCSRPSYNTVSAMVYPAWQGSQPKAADIFTRFGLQAWVLLIIEDTEGLTP